MPTMLNITIKVRHDFMMPLPLVAEIEKHFQKDVNCYDIHHNEYKVFIYTPASRLQKEQIEFIRKLEKNPALIVESVTDDELLFEALSEYEDNFADNVDFK